MSLALPEWTVLALLREEPRHGFAIAALTAPDGPIGRVWQIPRPVIYRALGRLETAGMITPLAVESGPGPQRTVYVITSGGRLAVDDWTQLPTGHVRELRSHLLLKLALLRRRDIDPHSLLRRQKDLLEPIVAALADERDRQQDFEAVLAAWRHTNAAAALHFITELLGDEPGPAAPG